MIVNDMILNADCEEVIAELQRQLAVNQINLLQRTHDAGRNIQVQCPYHGNGQERRPSAGIRKEDGLFHCFACGQAHTLPEVISYCFGHHEDVLGKFGMNWLITNFATIRKEERKDVEIDMERNNSTSKNTRLEHTASFEPNFVSEEELDSYRYYHSYWADRGITDENIIELFDLGYDIRTNCITFPVRDIEGNCVFVARRNVSTKWFNYPKDVEKPLYGLYEFSKQKEVFTFPRVVKLFDGSEGIAPGISVNKLYITESMIDCLLLWQAGKYAVALNGTGSKEQIKVLQELPIRHYVLATDNDEAGQRAREKLRKALPQLITEINFPDNRKDIGECTKEEIDNIEQWEVF